VEKGNPFISGMNKYSGFQTLRPKPKAVVIGGGFIGLEMVENLVHKDFDVTLVEMIDQVLPPIDKEHASVVHSFLIKHGVQLALSDGVAGFKQAAGNTIDVDQIRKNISGRCCDPGTWRKAGHKAGKNGWPGDWGKRRNTGERSNDHQ
jgi:NADPH-dependent 2,4-dienoyl-CoA reductase/sulfur reductase-like enzyme